MHKAIILQPTFTAQGVDSTIWNFVILAWHDDVYPNKRLRWAERLVEKKKFHVIEQDIDNLLRIAEETLSGITLQDLS